MKVGELQVPSASSVGYAVRALGDLYRPGVNGVAPDARLELVLDLDRSTLTLHARGLDERVKLALERGRDRWERYEAPAPTFRHEPEPEQRPLFVASRMPLWKRAILDFFTP